MKKNYLVLLIVVVVVSMLVVGCGGSSTPAPGTGGNTVPEGPWEPNRPVTLMSWAGAGGGMDIFNRAVQRASERNDVFPVPVATINQPGSGGAEGMRYLLASPADGHLLLGGVNPNIILTPLNNDLGFNYKSYRPIAMMGVGPLHLAVRSDDDRFSTIEEFVAYAKANPGTLSVGTFGAGTQMDVALLLLADGTQIEVNAIPFEGTGPRLAAILGGHIDATVDTLSATLEQIEVGSLRSLVHFSDRPIDIIAGVPSVNEAFGFEVVIEQWRGVLAHGDTPDNVVEYLVDKFKEIYDTDDFQQFLEQEGYVAVYRTPEEFAQFLDREYEIFNKVFEDNKLGIYSK